ncbi:hypothetical protein IC575_010334 [Cucumis melo]
MALTPPIASATEVTTAANTLTTRASSRIRIQLRNLFLAARTVDGELFKLEITDGLAKQAIHGDGSGIMV